LSILSKRIKDIQNWASTDFGQTYSKKWSQMYFPAASACYAYEPKIKDNETLCDKFKIHNWALPSLGLAIRIAWYTFDYNDATFKIRENSPLLSVTNKNGKVVFEMLKSQNDSQNNLWSVNEINSTGNVFNVPCRTGNINVKYITSEFYRSRPICSF
jgi:hypothetical protein